jgi:hypothetical protein
MPLWPKKLKKGEEITEAWIDSLVSAIEQTVRPQPPLRFERTRKGLLLMSGEVDGSGILLAKSPTAGIAPGDFATVTFYKRGTLNTLGTVTGRVRNPGPDFCPGNKKLWIGTVNGVPKTVLFWSCNDA